jgi:hypothetical protein
MIQEQNIGGGIALNKDFDLMIDDTGDIKTITGVDEVKKDISYNITENLQEILGKPKTKESAYEAKRVCYDTVDSYANVGGIEAIRIGFGNIVDDFDLAIEMIITINDEQKELVVTV